MTDDQPTVDDQPYSKAYTAPKGRPTRARGRVAVRRRVFGPSWQWVALVVGAVAIVAIVILVTNGGDFNPYNDGSAPAEADVA